MKNWFNKKRLIFLVLLTLLSGFLIRIHFVNKVVVGDLLSYEEWGRKLFQFGPSNYYFRDGWYYSVPNYPPIAIWLFGLTAWLNDKRYLIAQLHNLVKFPPSMFIIYFYDWGNILLIKLIPIISDLGIGIITYKLVKNLTRSFKKGIFALLFYMLSPLSVFISGAWGQTDSVVALFGMLAFIFLVNKNIVLSLPLMFLSLYFKFSWAPLIPFYVLVLFTQKPKLKQVLLGILISFSLFVVSTIPFSDGNFFSYAWKLFWQRYPISIGFIGKASISAFNFQTIFWKIDVDFANAKMLGVSTGTWGLIIYGFLNYLSFKYFLREKNKIVGILAGIFTIGMGSFLFMPVMLERYFFPAFSPMVILAFWRPKLIFSLTMMNIILFANVIYSFYRRGSDEIYHFFIDNNYLLIRMASFLQVVLFTTFIKNIVLQFKRESS